MTFAIVPYKLDDNTWRFDDPARGIKREELVGGTDQLIERATERITTPEKGFWLMFSDNEFPGMQYTLDLEKAEESGNTYQQRAKR